MRMVLLEQMAWSSDVGLLRVMMKLVTVLGVLEGQGQQAFASTATL